jgi:hypothetical protein
MADMTSLKGVSEKDRQLVEGVEVIFGPELSTMGFAKNLFWDPGRTRKGAADGHLRTPPCATRSW